MLVGSGSGVVVVLNSLTREGSFAGSRSYPVRLSMSLHNWCYVTTLGGLGSPLREVSDGRRKGIRRGGE